MANKGAALAFVPPKPAEPLDWHSAYPAQAWKRIKYEGFYLVLLLLLMVVVATLIFKLNTKTHPILKELLSCGLGGIVGSWIYAIRWYVKAVVGKLWAHDFIVWRLSAPWMGIFLAVSTYLIIKTGLFGVVINQNTNNLDPNMYPYAIGFLVGLFSDEVMKKLAAVANTLFGQTDTGGKTKDTNHPQGSSSAATTP